MTFVRNGITIMSDRYCPTWEVYPHVGWRGFLIRRLGLPKRWFKPERRERKFYRVAPGLVPGPKGYVVLCSPENYAYLRDLVPTDQDPALRADWPLVS